MQSFFPRLFFGGETSPLINGRRAMKGNRIMIFRAVDFFFFNYFYIFVLHWLEDSKQPFVLLKRSLQPNILLMEILIGPNKGTL